MDKIEQIENEILALDTNFRKTKVKLTKEMNAIATSIQKSKNSTSDKVSSISSKLEEKSRSIALYQKDMKPAIEMCIKATPVINYLPAYTRLRMSLFRNVEILLRHGVHFVTALQGGGKSSLAYDIAEQIYYETGKAAYINADFERPRFNAEKQKWVKHHQTFKLSEYFNSVWNEKLEKYEIKQLKKFNKHMDTVILDEWLTEMNHRMNKTKDYNDVFMALITMIAHMRHQGVKRVYVLSQIDNTDVQLSSMFKYVHEVEVKLGNSYWKDFQTHGNYHDNVKGWHVSSYKVKRDRKKRSNEKYLVASQYRHATADFQYFDTLSMASKYNNVPEDRLLFA